MKNLFVWILSLLIFVIGCSSTPKSQVQDRDIMYVPNETYSAFDDDFSETSWDNYKNHIPYSDRVHKDTKYSSRKNALAMVGKKSVKSRKTALSHKRSSKKVKN